MARIFLSHAHTDKAKVRRLADALRRAGHQPWLDEEVILVGEAIPSAVARGLKDTDYVVLCLSQASIYSGWVEAEVSLVVMRQFSERRERVLPVRFDKVKPPDILADRSYVDLFPGKADWTRGIEKLLESIAGYEARRGAAGAPPAGPSMPPNNLPARRQFVGRAADLAAVHKALAKDGQATITQAAAVYGLGGVGKTALALEYAYRHATDYPSGVWWLLAEGSPMDGMLRLSADLRLLAPSSVRAVVEAVPIDGKTADLAHAAKLGLQQGEQPALLVLDNVDQAGWNEWRPGGAVRIVMTARDKTFAVGKARLLEGLSDQDARDLADKLGAVAAGPDETAARDRVVITQLEALPVAVELAARAVNDWGLRWSRYAEELDKHSKLLEDPELLREHYPRGAWAAIDLSLGRCPPGETARKLLEGAAAFAPENVPLDWALTAAGIEPEASGFEVERVLGRIAGLGLAKVDREGQRLSLHRLVRRRLRENAEPEQWKAMRQRGANAVWVWLDETVDESRIAEVDARRGHADEALSAAEEVKDDLLWIRIADRIAMHLKHRAEFASSLELFHRALEKAEALDPPNPARLATSLSHLALVLRALGDAAGARPLLERALGIDEKIFGPDHPEVAMDLSNLALVLSDLGDAAGARPLLERALGIDEKIFGPDHPEVARDLSNLATVLRDLGDAAGARPLLQRTLGIDEKTFGADHPNVANTLSALALVLSDLGDAAGARPLLERAIAIDEKTFGPDHPKLATRFSNLALVLRDLGDAAEARPLLERALSIDEKTFGPDHPKVATRLSNLAMVLHALGDAAGARPLLERALGIDKKTFGPDHPKVATRLSNLAMVLLDLGDPAAAKRLLLRAQAIAEKALPANHPSLVIIRNNLAGL